MDYEKAQDLVLASTREVNGQRRISCAQAFEVHHQHGIALGDIGKICDENNVRICACQLGCFK
jgi:hypothetical protein